MSYHCPYCKGRLLDWTSNKDELIWAGDDWGDVVTTISCNSPGCMKRFKIRHGFELCKDDIGYYSEEDEELEIHEGGAN